MSNIDIFQTKILPSLNLFSIRIPFPEKMLVFTMGKYIRTTFVIILLPFMVSLISLISMGCLSDCDVRCLTSSGNKLPILSFDFIVLNDVIVLIGFIVINDFIVLNALH